MQMIHNLCLKSGTSRKWGNRPMMLIIVFAQRWRSALSWMVNVMVNHILNTSSVLWQRHSFLLGIVYHIFILFTEVFRLWYKFFQVEGFKVSNILIIFQGYMAFSAKGNIILASGWMSSIKCALGCTILSRHLAAPLPKEVNGLFL